jgi:hypothetical protein
LLLKIIWYTKKKINMVTRTPMTFTSCIRKEKLLSVLLDFLTGAFFRDLANLKLDEI